MLSLDLCLPMIVVLFLVVLLLIYVNCCFSSVKIYCLSAYLLCLVFFIQNWRFSRPNTNEELLDGGLWRFALENVIEHCRTHHPHPRKWYFDMWEFFLIENLSFACYGYLYVRFYNLFAFSCQRLLDLFWPCKASMVFGESF